jgi:1-deoxy-D-xylulose-5-phosphate synthase
MPNMVVMAPKDENELQHMLKTGLSYEGPASVRYPRGVSLGVAMDRELHEIPIGKGELLRDGTDVAIIAIGVSVWSAVKAAEQLSEEGLSTAVVNARFVKPLDRELIVSVANRVRYVVTVEEGCQMGGFGSAVLEALSEAGVTVKTKILGLPDWYIEQGPQDLLRERYGLTTDGIYRSVKELVMKSPISTREPEFLAASVDHSPHGDEQGS